MSIINEALQKAGEIKKTSMESPAKYLKKNIVELPAKSKKILKYKWFYFIGIIILLIFAILYSLSGRKIPYQENAMPAKTAITAKPEIIQERPHESAADKALPIIQPGLPDPSEFRLAGIVLGEGAPMAIINDSVYMTGDMIRDLKIAEITKNTVSLEKDGRTIELRVK
jgi:type II secretory pathway component PulC